MNKKKSGIIWTDVTWSLVTGCQKVSEGCRNCYAEREVEGRWSKNPKSVFFERQFTDVQWHEKQLHMPLKWKEPQRIFLCPRGDLFHKSVPDDFLDRVFAVMALAPQHTFQVLTKRADSVLQFFTADGEGYDLIVKVVPAEVENNLQLPYAESIGRGLGRDNWVPFDVPTD